MNIDEWWPRLDSSTREWLIAHNGEPVPPSVREELTAVGAADDLKRGDDHTHLPDDLIDWIEAVANDEDPA